VEEDCVVIWLINDQKCLVANGEVEDGLVNSDKYRSAIIQVELNVSNCFTEDVE
jgi:hypothetical protein